MESSSSFPNQLILWELRYNRGELCKKFDNLVFNLTDEQHVVYDIIISSVESNKGGVFFVYSCGGTGKTYVWRTLSATLRSKGEIVLNVASSGIVSLLFPGGRTAHSRFTIPIGVPENSTCNIYQGTELAELIIKCKLIIWDEAPMMHKYCFEVLGNSLKDVIKVNDSINKTLPYGGKTVVFCGDFRQILPVIPKGSRQHIVHATINSSDIWEHCKVLRLTKTMRLRNLGADIDGDELKKFSEWIASISDGTIGGSNHGCAKN